MFPFVFPKDNDVVHQAQNTRQVVKYLIHPPLEVLWGTGDAEGHLVETKMAEWGETSLDDETAPLWGFAKTC